jgi:WD40 repeat protein
LAQAEQWRDNSFEKEPVPSPLHLDFIAASREEERNANRRQRALFWAISVIGVVALVLAVVALLLFQRAEEKRLEAERNEAKARSLALTAGAGQLYEEGHYLLALSLAMEANKIPDAPLPAQWKLSEIAYAPGIRRILAHHTLPVMSVAFSPDGERALSGSCSQRDGECTAGELVLWNTETGEEIRSFSGHTDTVTCVAISPHGRTALSGSRDTTLILWDMETGEQMRQFRGHSMSVGSLAFSPDGHTALSGSFDNTLILWDLETGREIRRFRGHKEGVMSIVFSPDGLTALSGSLDNTLILWDVDSGQPIRDFSGHENDVYSVAIGLGGRTALSGSCGIFDPRGGLSIDDECTEGQLILWDVATGEPIRDFRGHSDFVAGVAFGPNGQTALSAAYHDPTLIIWDIATGQPLRTISGAEGGVGSLATSPDGHTALTGYADGTLHVWDLNSEQPIDTIDLSSEYATSWRFDYDFINSTVFNLDKNTAMSVGCDRTSPSGFCESGKLVLWDLKTEQPIQVYRGHSADIARWPISSVALSPDGLLAVSAGCYTYDFLTCTESDFILWDLKTGERLRTSTGHTSLVESVAFSPDGRMFLSGSCTPIEPEGPCAQGELILWDAQTGEQIQQYYGHTRSVSSVTFGPDGQTAISGSDDGTLILWDLETGEQLRTFIGHTGSIAWVAFSPDSQTAMSASQDNMLILWDLETGEQLRTFIGHTGGVTCVAFSPDSQTAISGSRDDTLILWDLETGEQLCTLTGHEKGIHSVAFGTAGKTAISSSDDGTVVIWRIDSPTALVEWTNDNRAVIVPDCQTGELYGVEPKCDDIDSF